MMKCVLAGLVAGAIAISLNSLALAAADLVPIATAHGGLLRLLTKLSGLHLAVTSTPIFQVAFHIVVGLAMAVVYALVLEPWLPGPSIFKGLVYAGAVWIVNSVIVLPVIGEGFAGRNNLSLFGMMWFAAAHTLFFVLLAILYPFVRARFDRARPNLI